MVTTKRWILFVKAKLGCKTLPKVLLDLRLWVCSILDFGAVGWCCLLVIVVWIDCGYLIADRTTQGTLANVVLQ